MAIKAKTLLANRKNYGNKRSLSTIRYIVIHYTANDGDHDENNANYFSKNVVKASAHYFVDDDSYTKSVPLSYVAWSVGGEEIPELQQDWRRKILWQVHKCKLHQYRVV